jgi:hypothetical protein
MYNTYICSKERIKPQNEVFHLRINVQNVNGEIVAKGQWQNTFAFGFL